MRHSIKISIIIILTFLVNHNSKACNCNPPAFAFLDSTELKEYDFIARVKILDAYDSKKSSKYDYITIQILELFKGKAITQIVEELKNTSCDIGISDGEEWILFCKKENGKISQGVCDRYQKIRESDGLRSRDYNNDFNPLWKLRQFYGHPERKFNTEGHKENYPNGQIEIEEYYLNGKLEGERRMWYPSGILLSRDYYIHGVIEGKSESFYSSGQIESESFYKNGEHYNTAKYYYDSTYEDWERYSLIEQYKTKDSLDFVYKRVQVEHEYIYDPNGNMILWKDYSRVGQITREQIIVDPERDYWIVLEYHENGKISSISYVLNYKNYGHHQLYDEQGFPLEGWDYNENGERIK